MWSGVVLPTFQMVSAGLLSVSVVLSQRSNVIWRRGRLRRVFFEWWIAVHAAAAAAAVKNRVPRVASPVIAPAFSLSQLMRFAISRP